MRVAVAGRGRVGRGLYRALRNAGERPRLIDSRGDLSVGNADVLVLAISDGAIEVVAARVSPFLRPGSIVLHCAGAIGPSALATCADAGAAVGVMHPLVSFPTRDAAPDLAGTTFVIDGHRRAVVAAKKIAGAVGARALTAKIHGSSYHAAAALLANGSAALASVSVRLLSRLGVDIDDAEHAMGALLRSVAYNIETVGVPMALTGPVARGDAATVRGHRAALRRYPRALEAYEAVGPIILRVARDGGLTGARATAVRKALTARVRG